MLDALGFSQTGAKQLEVARKMNPGLLCRSVLAEGGGRGGRRGLFPGLQPLTALITLMSSAKPSLDSSTKANCCRFILFVRQQQATQKAASSTVGKGGSMDLLGWVALAWRAWLGPRGARDTAVCV